MPINPTGTRFEAWLTDRARAAEWPVDSLQQQITLITALALAGAYGPDATAKLADSLNVDTAELVAAWTPELGIGRDG